MLRVMLVDDSQKEVSLLKEGLQAAGYDVVTATSAALALLDRVAAMQPDVIIIDTDSPTRDTLEHLVVDSARSRGRSCCSPRTRATRRSRRRSRPACPPTSWPACSRIACSRSSTWRSRASSRSARCATSCRSAQTKLAERKVIERAKGIVMKQKGVAEDEAYRLMRKLAMDRNARLLDVAQQVIDVADLLG